MKILAGDVGGTTTRLALFDWTEPSRVGIASENFPSRHFSGLEEVVERFMATAGERCERACFGLAGPVGGRVARTTNLPWLVDADALERRLGFQTVLINDLEAVGWGIPMLAPEDVVVLAAGTAGSVGNRAVIAAGTGLGEAGMYFDGVDHRPFACEGGHASFAASTEEQWQLQRYLAGRHGHVSWERVVSGPGLESIYAFQCARMGVPHVLKDAAAIGDSARAGDSAASTAALGLFLELLGAEAGNLALKTMATGGVFVAGGIAPRLVEPLTESRFMEAFRDKGRMRPLLERIPVSVIVNEAVGLAGAARRAATL
jgi:glucokinase